MMGADSHVVVVVPCLNEAGVLKSCHDALIKVFDDSYCSEHGVVASVMFVDDGSDDSTWDEICRMSEEHDNVSGVRLSRNFGQQPAILAGYESALFMDADAVVVMDADLQDDPSVIRDMVDAWQSGADIVFGVRADRSSDAFAKRMTANAYYGLSKWLGVPSAGNASEFSLMSRRAVLAIIRYGERDIYLRGVRASLGFKVAYVEYTRAPRVAGEPAYTWKKSADLALSGVFSYSRRPLSFVSGMAFVSSVVAVIMVIWAIVQYATGHAIGGWTSVIVSIWIVAAMLLGAASIVCGYIGEILVEAKGRPRYIIMDKVGHIR